MGLPKLLGGFAGENGEKRPLTHAFPQVRNIRHEIVPRKPPRSSGKMSNLGPIFCKRAQKMGSTASASPRRFRAPKDNAEKSTSTARNNVDVLHCRCCALPMDYISRWQYLTASACRHISPYTRPAPRNRQTPGVHRADISIRSTTSSCTRDVRHPEPLRQPAAPAGPPHRLADAPTCTLCRHCKPTCHRFSAPRCSHRHPQPACSPAAFACGDNLLSGLPITRYSEPLILWCRR